MACPLLGPVTRRHADHSTAKVFAFGFFCDQCGKEWRSAPQPFDPGAFGPKVDIRVYRMLRDDQHKAAYERANLEAICAFIRCPECGLWVCADCFYQSETDATEICKDCLSKRRRAPRRGLAE